MLVTLVEAPWFGDVLEEDRHKLLAEWNDTPVLRGVSPTLRSASEPDAGFNGGLPKNVRLSYRERSHVQRNWLDGYGKKESDPSSALIY